MVEKANALREMSSAASAFDELRGEVSLLRRAVEALTAERRQSPDYSRTLEALAASNEELREWARKINAQPAMRLTPGALRVEIEAIVARFHEHDQKMLEVVSKLTRTSHAARTRYEQVRREKLIGGTCFLSGMMLLLLLLQVTL